MDTYNFESTILDLPFPVWSYSIHVESFGMLDPENMGVAFEIVFLSPIIGEI